MTGSSFKPVGISIALLALAGATRAQNTEQMLERQIENQQQALDELRRELEALKAAQAPGAASASGSADEGQSGAEEAENAGEPAEDQALLGPFVFRASDELTVRFSGRVHQMIMNVHDGIGTTNLFTDSEQGPTMLRFDADGKPSEDLSLGATLEVGIRQNRPFLVSQDTPNVGTNVAVRIAEVSIDATSFGRFSLGQGFAAAWLTPEIDLSGTQFASLLSVGMLAPGLKFADASTGRLTDIRVFQYFADLERLLLIGRLRFDSASFGPGVQLSGSVATDSRWDVALRAKPEPTERWTVVGGASYQKEPYAGFERRADAGVSVLQNKTGLNLTAAVSREELTNGRDVDTYIVKAGWLAELVGIGQTAFSVDYYKNRDLRVTGDRSTSVGLFVVQKWPAFGTDFYGGIRRYEVDRPDIDLDPLDVIVVGAVLRF